MSKDVNHSHNICWDSSGEKVWPAFTKQKMLYLFSLVLFVVRLWHLIWISIFFNLQLIEKVRRNIKRTSLQLIGRAAIEIKN